MNDINSILRVRGFGVIGEYILETGEEEINIYDYLGERMLALCISYFTGVPATPCEWDEITSFFRWRHET